MNTNASTSTSPSHAASRETRDAQRRTDPDAMRREGDRFERLLRDKSGSREDEDDTASGSPAPECTTPPVLGNLPPPMHAQAAAAAAVRAGAATLDTATPTQAALGTAMAAQQPQTPQTQGADPHTFQVSINEPMGLPLELRAVRVPATGAVQAPALWALNIAAPSRDAVHLARHGARLDERLRARGIDPSLVQVERGDEGDEQAD